MTEATPSMRGSALPRVSIGVPVYNGERYLAETLDSLLAQTFRDIEIIIGDNCSTDSTESICRDYAARDSRVRYLRHEKNLGIAGNYNRLVQHARGELFRWNAADDLVLPRATEVCVAALDRDPLAVMAYPKTSLVDAEGKWLEDYEDRANLIYDRPSERFIKLLEALALCNVVFGLIRISVLRRMGAMRAFVGSDIPFMAELALYGRFIEVPERLFLRRLHPGASSALKGGPGGIQHLFTPDQQVKGTPDWDRLRVLTRAVTRGPIPIGEKLRLGVYLGRMVRGQRHDLARDLGTGLRALATSLNPRRERSTLRP